MFLKKMNRFLSRIPVSIRVTVWFSSVIVILFLIILSSLILIEDKVVNDLSQKELVEAVEEIYEDPEKFENFNDGIYYIKYNEQNEIIAGKFPKDFDIALAFSIEDINIYQVENKKFLYYDTRLQDEDDWIRGIYPLGKVQKEIETLWNIAIALSVLFLIFVVIVGYRIIKNAFKPVKQISDTALKIKRSKDFSNRIELEDSNDDEIHKMASTFNEMLDTVEEVFIHEKQFSSDVSHELRTPITVILAQSDYALQYSDTLEETKESLEVINRHAKRMTNLINQIMELSKLERQKEIEKEEFIKTLDGEIYTLPSYRRNYIIQRLNSFVSDGAVKFNGKIFTIEHVLPQNPRMDSQWLAVWSEADRKIWVNKIANLVALTRQHNSQAQNYDFEEKKQKYFQSSNGVTSYPITTQVNGIKHWNPRTVETRQNELMKVFIDKWRLKLNGEVIES